MLRKISSLAMIAIFWTRVSSLAYAGPTEDASAVIDQWVAAFNSGDVEKMVATYAPDATLYGTLNPNLASGHEALRTYFGPPAKNKPQVKMGGSLRSCRTMPSSSSAFTSSLARSRVGSLSRYPPDTPLSLPDATISGGSFTTIHRHGPP